MDAKANDLFHWQTNLLVSDTTSLEQRLRAENSRFVSPDIIKLTDSRAGFDLGLLVRDPDGHVMALIEKAKTAAAAGKLK